MNKSQYTGKKQIVKWYTFEYEYLLRYEDFQYKNSEQIQKSADKYQPIFLMLFVIMAIYIHTQQRYHCHLTIQ